MWRDVVLGTEGRVWLFSDLKPEDCLQFKKPLGKDHGFWIAHPQRTPVGAELDRNQ